MISLLDFIQKYLDQPNVGTTPENRGQCVGLVEQWLADNGRPAIWGNACDLLANADLKTYRVYKNGPLNYPVWGDIVCWDATWGNGDGHTGVVVAAKPMLLSVYQANNPTGATPRVLTHPYDHVMGWIRLPRGDA